jgi:hypothetical protein
MGTFDAWDALLAEPDPDPLEIIRLAGMFSRYLDAVANRAATEAWERGATVHDLSSAYGHPRKPTPWIPPGRTGSP